MGKGVIVVGLSAGVALAACAVAGVAVGRRLKSRRKWGKMVEILKELEESFDTQVGKLKQVVDAMAVEMHAGLASEGGSKLRMLLTYAENLPNGTIKLSVVDMVDTTESSIYRRQYLVVTAKSEKGTYYALDFEGTYFRILRVQLGEQRSLILGHGVEREPVPEHLMSGRSEDLFNFIALSLKKFVEREDDSGYTLDRRRELGFTFSFPVKQTSISSGFLIKWTKGFDIKDMVGKEVVESFQQALTRKGLNMQVAALVNDTVGTLALGHYHDTDTVAAVIIGTGTNACYLERADAIIKCQGLLTASGGMVVNMEWGNFWSSHLPRTSYDVDLDADSPNPSDQGFEKMIAGMYLGEIVRRVMLRMSLESDIFGHECSKLSLPFILRTPLMAAMHEDETPDLAEVSRILREILEVPEVPLKVRKLVVNICDVVTRRAARLSAAGIAGILKKIGRDGSGGIASGRSRHDIKMRRTVVAIEGGLYTNYSIFREYLNEALVEILGEEVAKHVVLKVTEDGSGIGAALLAASNSVDSTSSDGRSIQDI